MRGVARARPLRHAMPAPVQKLTAPTVGASSSTKNAGLLEHKNECVVCLPRGSYCPPGSASASLRCPAKKIVTVVPLLCGLAPGKKWACEFIGSVLTVPTRALLCIGTAPSVRWASPAQPRAPQRLRLAYRAPSPPASARVPARPARRAMPAPTAAPPPRSARPVEEPSSLVPECAAHPVLCVEGDWSPEGRKKKRKETHTSKTRALFERHCWAMQDHAIAAVGGLLKQNPLTAAIVWSCIEVLQKSFTSPSKAVFRGG